MKWIFLLNIFKLRENCLRGAEKAAASSRLKKMQKIIFFAFVVRSAWTSPKNFRNGSDVTLAMVGIIVNV